MMNLLATVSATLPLLIGGGDNAPFYMAELGGMVVEQRSGQPFPSPVPVSIKLYSSGECLAGTTVGLDGRYSLQAPPGDYWVQILLGNAEVLAEKVVLGAGSSLRDFRAPSLPTTAPSTSVVASRKKSESAGIGGAGDVGSEENSAFLGDAHRSGMLMPSLKPMPKWWEEMLKRPAPEFFPSAQARSEGVSRPASSPPRKQ